LVTQKVVHQSFNHTCAVPNPVVCSYFSETKNVLVDNVWPALFQYNESESTVQVPKSTFFHFSINFHWRYIIIWPRNNCFSPFLFSPWRLTNIFKWDINISIRNTKVWVWNFFL